MSFIALFTFTTYLWIYIVIISPLCVLVRQSRVALVDYVSPLWGLNSHVSPRGAWPEKHASPCLNNAIYCFIYIYYALVNILCGNYSPFPCVLVRQSRVALVDYVSPLWGLNNHVSPRGTWPEKHNPHVQILSFIILLRCKYYIVIFSPFFLCDLGVIIPIGRGGLCETSMRLYPPCNPIGVGPTKILYFKPHYFRHLWCHCDYSHFPCVLVQQSRVALVDYVSPLLGLNSHVSPRGTWPEKHNPHVQIPSFIILLHCEYCYSLPLFSLWFGRDNPDWSWWIM